MQSMTTWGWSQRPRSGLLDNNRLGPIFFVDGSPQSGLYIAWTGKMPSHSKETPDLLPGTLYLLILRTLARGPLHGYAISRRIKEASAEVLDVEEGSLYPALNRMLIKGWLTSEWGMSENNRKARFYRLTAQGRKQLEREADGFDNMVRAIQLVMRTV
jgi:PadR family transcriptional regulator, regulatory protein PadR